MTRLLLISSFLVVAAMATVSHGEAQAPTNEMCPVLTDERVDPDIFAEYQGKRVYLCCMRCKKMFLANPTQYIGNLPQFSVTGAERQEDEHEHAHAPQETVAGKASEQDEAAHHDHATGHEKPRGSSRLIRFLGQFHPIAVHFPIALVVAASLAEALAWLTRRSFFAGAARFSVAVAALTAILAVLLGWAAGAFAHYPGELARVLTIHRWLGTSSGLLIVMAAVLSEAYHLRGNGRLRLAYRSLLFGSMVLVGLTGYFGASLIYGLGHFTW